MKIAIDCAGTLLEREHQPKLLDFIEKALSKDHQILIWSNSSAYVLEAVKIVQNAQIKGRERVTHSRKLTKVDVKNDEGQFVDLAIDDSLDSAYILASRRTIHPNDIGDVSL